MQEQLRRPKAKRARTSNAAVEASSRSIAEEDVDEDEEHGEDTVVNSLLMLQVGTGHQQVARHIRFAAGCCNIVAG